MIWPIHRISTEFLFSFKLSCGEKFGIFSVFDNRYRMMTSIALWQGDSCIGKLKINFILRLKYERSDPFIINLDGNRNLLHPLLSTFRFRFGHGQFRVGEPWRTARRSRGKVWDNLDWAKSYFLDKILISFGKDIRHKSSDSWGKVKQRSF